MATLPCIGIARTAGLKLREMLKSGPGARVVPRQRRERLAARADHDRRDQGPHATTSWWSAATRTPGPDPQATDNAAGNACILELARVFNQHRDKLRRGLVFGFWTGHETGTMIGSAWFVDRNWDRLREHAVAYLQIDQPACAGTTRWSAASNVELKRFHQGDREAHPRQPAARRGGAR